MKVIACMSVQLFFMCLVLTARAQSVPSYEINFDYEGTPEYQYKMGNWQIDGNKNYQAAFEWFKRAADNLSACILEGRFRLSEEINKEELAVSWLVKAAQLGNELASSRLNSLKKSGLSR